MKGYGTREVSKMLGLTENQVRAYVRSGFLAPARGRGGAYRFAFEDLVFLRTAKGLLEARIGPRRVRRALRKLRTQLPAGSRLGGLRITAEGDRIVVGDGSARWQPESGQFLFDFEVAELAEKAAPVVRSAFHEAKKDAEGLSAQNWYEWGCELEPAAPAEAREAYERALALDPEHAEAHVNLGRSLHEAGDAAAAEKHYRSALAARPEDATAAFNLGVALQDLGRPREAIEVYELATRIDPECADAYYNAACLYETLGEVQAALRHLKDYRKIIRAASR